MAKKIIVTAALTGAVTPKELNPYIPLTPEEIAEDADKCWKAGAAIGHLHMRDDEGDVYKRQVVNCLGTEKLPDVSIPELLVRQVQSSVYMEESIRYLVGMGLDALVEIGPGKALSGFVKKTVPGMPVYAVETVADVEKLTELVKE